MSMRESFYNFTKGYFDIAKDDDSQQFPDINEMKVKNWLYLVFPYFMLTGILMLVLVVILSVFFGVNSPDGISFLISNLVVFKSIQYWSWISTRATKILNIKI